MSIGSTHLLLDKGTNTTQLLWTLGTHVLDHFLRQHGNNFVASTLVEIRSQCWLWSTRKPSCISLVSSNTGARGVRAGRHGRKNLHHVSVNAAQSEHAVRVVTRQGHKDVFSFGLVFQGRLPLDEELLSGQDDTFLQMWFQEFPRSVRHTSLRVPFATSGILGTKCSSKMPARVPLRRRAILFPSGDMDANNFFDKSDARRFSTWAVSKSPV